MSDPGPIGSATIGTACALFDKRGRVLLERRLPRPISDFTERRIRDALTANGVFDVVTKREWRE